MRICITLDDVIRAKTRQFAKIFAKSQGKKEEDMSDIEISTNDLCEVFGMQRNDYNTFLYGDYPFEMFGNHDLRKVEAPRGFSLRFYLQYQNEKGWGWITRIKHFNALAGSDQLYNQLKAGMTEAQIRQSWQADLEQFKALRKQYAIYQLSE